MVSFFFLLISKVTGHWTILHAGYLKELYSLLYCEVELIIIPKRIPVAYERVFSSMYGEGRSLRYISQNKKVSLSTVKKYLSANKVDVVQKNIVKTLNNEDELLIGLYIGIWAGDGCQYFDGAYTIKICCHSGRCVDISWLWLTC